MYIFSNSRNLPASQKNIFPCLWFGGWEILIQISQNLPKRARFGRARQFNQKWAKIQGSVRDHHEIIRKYDYSKIKKEDHVIFCPENLYQKEAKQRISIVSSEHTCQKKKVMYPCKVLSKSNVYHLNIRTRYE